MDHNINRTSQRICHAAQGIFLLTWKLFLISCVESNEVYQLLEIIHCCNKVTERKQYSLGKTLYQYKAFIIETSVSHLLRFSTKFKSLQVHRLTEDTSSVCHLLRFSSRYKALQPHRLIIATSLESLLIDFFLPKHPSSVGIGIRGLKNIVCQILSKTYIYNFKVI